MKLLLSILILTLSSFCSGQNFDLIKGKTEDFYKITLNNSIDLDIDYPNGRYKLFSSDSSKLPKYVFCIKNNMVNGPFLEFGNHIYTYGNYFNDSTWSFLTSPEDTTFKTGTWRTIYDNLGYSGNYDNRSTKEIIHKMPFDSLNTFKELWYYHNGYIAREAIFQKGFGLLKETYWNFETKEISKQTINKGNKNYYQSTVYENDSISYVSLFQNGIEIVINFNYMPYSCENQPCTEVSVYTDNWERNDIPMASMSIDSTKTLTDFDDIKRQIFFSEDKDGNIQVRGLNKKVKLKIK